MDARVTAEEGSLNITNYTLRRHQEAEEPETHVEPCTVLIRQSSSESQNKHPQSPKWLITQVAKIDTTVLARKTNKQQRVRHLFERQFL